MLLLVEHPPVFTIGRNGSRKNILASLSQLKKEGIKVYEIDRGGDITYHGPGQIVGYPIIDLKNYGKDIHVYLRTLEEVLIKLLKDFDIEAKRIKGMTGVWVHPVRSPSDKMSEGSPNIKSGLTSNGASKKIAFIEIRVSKWIAYHGFALNVEPNMEHFSFINPCGLGKSVTSMKEQLGERCPGRKKIEERLVRKFMEIFSERK